MKALSARINRHFSRKSLFYNPNLLNGKLTPEERFLKKQEQRLKKHLVKLLVKRDLYKANGKEVRNINFQIQNTIAKITKNKEKLIR